MIKTIQIGSGSLRESNLEDEKQATPVSPGRQQLPFPPRLEGVTSGDIPHKYYKPCNDLGKSAFCIHAELKHFRKAFSLIKNLPDTSAMKYNAKINEIFARDAAKEKALVTLSVRSAFDLYFQVKKFPPGSEVLMTAINIPDMVRIIEEHGCVPVPVDLDLDTFQPSLDQIKAATGPKTVCALFGFVFGITYSLEPYAEFFRERNIDIIEDCAQSFKSLDVFRGSPLATMTMFSFGTIKHNTAFYGAVSIVRESANLANRKTCNELHARMSKVQNTYRRYSRDDYMKKVKTALVVWVFLNSQIALKSAMKLCRMRNKDIEETIISSIRGFSADADFLQKFRVQPNAPLMAMIYERTANYTEADFLERNVNYRRMTRALTEAGIYVPGQFVKDRSFWLYIIPVQNSTQFRDYCHKQGLFVAQKASQITVVQGQLHVRKRNKEYIGTPNCQWLLDNCVALPVTDYCSQKHMDRMIKKSLRIFKDYNAYVKELEARVKKGQFAKAVPLYRAKL